MIDNTTVNGFKLIKTSTVTRTILESWAVYKDRKHEFYIGTIRKIIIRVESYEPAFIAWSYYAIEQFGHRRVTKQRVYNTRCEAVMGLAKLRKLVD